MTVMFRITPKSALTIIDDVTRVNFDRGVLVLETPRGMRSFVLMEEFEIIPTQEKK